MDETPVTGSEPGPEGTFVSRFVWTLTAPKRLFADIARGAQWWEAWVWTSVISGVVAYLSVPIQIQLARINPRGQSPEQVDQTIEAMEKFGFLGVISTPVVVLIGTLLVAGISYLLVTLLAQESGFKKYFTLMFWANLPVAIGQLLGTILTRMKGMEGIRTIHDASASFGPAVLADPEKQKVLYPVLASLDLFYVWFYILVGAGLVAIFRLSVRNAVMVVIPVWLLQVLFALMSARFAG
jgi:hypothetical protein